MGRPWSDRLGNWPVYAAATGAALALGTSAAASIIYSGISNFTVSVTVTNPGGRNAYDYFSVGTFAYPYLSAFHRNYSPTMRYGGVQISASCACSTKFFGMPFSARASNYPLKRFSFDQVISDGVVTGPGSTQLNGQGFLAAACLGSDFASCPGGSDFDLQPWGPSNATGFAGFKTFGGNFGWIRLKWNATDGFPNSITAIDWAIEDSGAPIIAGDAGVPEPGTMSMALLAAGAAGILAWRKRRNAASQPSA